MSNHENDQSDEIEVLSSIYPSELEILNSSPWKIRLTLQPDANIENCHGKMFI